MGACCNVASANAILHIFVSIAVDMCLNVDKFRPNYEDMIMILRNGVTNCGEY